MSELTNYNAAIYVRLSKEDEDASDGRKNESNSITNQKQLILDYLQDKPEINIVSVRIDDGYTGTNYDRPAFQLMMNDIKAGTVNCVVVKDLSRFGREYINAGKYIDRLFPFYGVRPPGQFWFTASAPVWSMGWFTIWRKKLKALLRTNYLTKLGCRCNIFL